MLDRVIDATSLLLLLSVILTFIKRPRALKRPPLIRDPWWIGLLALFVLLALSVPEAMPVHDHNAYLQRSDCARELSTCRVATWSQPTIRLYGRVLSLLPPHTQVLGYVSLAFTLLSIVLMGAFLQRLLEQRFDRADARLAAWLAAALCVLHPAFLRMSVAATFYPYTMSMLWAAGWFTLEAIERRSAAPTWAAFGFLALAASGNLVQLVWLPLFILAPLCWRKEGLASVSARSWQLFTLGALVFVCWLSPHLMAAYRETFGHEGVGIGRDLTTSLTNLLYWDARTTTLVPRLLFAGGLVYSAISLVARRWFLLPLLYAFFATELFFGAQVDLWTGYPTRFIHGFVSLYFSAILAALGALWPLERVAVGQRRKLVAAVALVVLVSTPTAPASFTFLREERMLNRELRAISAAIEHLPRHDVLVLPPRIMGFLADGITGSDPVEVAFPRGEYSRRLARRQTVAPRFWDLTRLLDGERRISEGEEVLVYVGSPLKSFVSGEIEGGFVPDDLERPLLTDLRKRFKLEPVYLFAISTEDNQAVAARLGAGLVDTVELGFYRLDASRSSPRPTQ